MKIRLLKPITVLDHPGVKVGDVFDIHAERGEILVRIGDAEAVSEKIQTREPVIENRDPAIELPKRKK